MKSFITMSSKGQFTLPAEIRAALELQAGDKLEMSFYPDRREVSMTKPLSAEELSDRATSYIKPGTKPLHDVDAYYQRHRQARQ